MPLTKLNHEKLNKLKSGTTWTTAESSVIDFQPIDAPRSHDPFTKWCLKCKEPFEYAGLDERGPLMKCCMNCRVDLEHEARLNDLDPTLADDVLVAAIKEIAATELVIVEQAHFARQARAAGNHARAVHHRNRMVLASKSKRRLLSRLA
ncbi:MAG: hypothetical protein JSS68_20090 [Actinobacteria bacterium]|nr:hypothetical protein [Actinomycetota bacterium]